jgi:hypothetical protein
MCTHQPPCPPADRPDRDAARTVAFHPEQGWSLLCNGVIVFDDASELLPDGRAVPPVQLAGTGRVTWAVRALVRAASSTAAVATKRCPAGADVQKNFGYDRR